MKACYFDIKWVDVTKSSTQSLHHRFLRGPACRETLRAPLGIALFGFCPYGSDERCPSRLQQLLEAVNVNQVDTDAEQPGCLIVQAATRLVKRCCR